MTSKRVLSVSVLVFALLSVIFACSSGGGDDPGDQSQSPIGDVVSPNIGILKGIQGGTFYNGHSNMTVSGFRMSRHEITRSQFLSIMGTDPSNAAYSSGMNDPVQRANWYHAIAFCNKLSLAEGLTPVYSVSVGGTPVNWSTLVFTDIPTTSSINWNAATATWTNNGYRLPTEMEWMWAAMGAPADGQGLGTNTVGYFKDFSGSTGSNPIGEYAVFGYRYSESGKTITERSNSVGSKLANELGLYDMSGNIHEWTWDWFGTYPTGSMVDYRGPDSGSYRVRHGGSWLTESDYCAIDYRSPMSPNFQDYDIGFRVVRP